MPFDFLDKRPIVIALAGSNGAGKSTFYESHLADAKAALGTLSFDGNPLLDASYLDTSGLRNHGECPANKY